MRVRDHARAAAAPGRHRRGGQRRRGGRRHAVHRDVDAAPQRARPVRRHVGVPRRPGGRRRRRSRARPTTTWPPADGRRRARRWRKPASPSTPPRWWSLSHWRPPSTAPKGFATWFFVAAGSDADVEIDGHEIHEHAWLAPVEVLRRRDAGEVTLVPPTFVTLTVLAQHATVADLLAALGAGTPERFHTQIGRDGETAMACWHGDEAYDAQPGSDRRPPSADHVRRRLALRTIADRTIAAVIGDQPRWRPIGSDRHVEHRPGVLGVGVGVVDRLLGRDAALRWIEQ